MIAFRTWVLLDKLLEHTTLVTLERGEGGDNETTLIKNSLKTFQ